jgi:hypothetical protein
VAHRSHAERETINLVINCTSSKELGRGPTIRSIRLPNQLSQETSNEQIA